MRPVLIFMLICIVVFVFCRKNRWLQTSLQQHQDSMKHRLQRINDRFYNGHGVLEKEESIKINKTSGEINNSRYTWMLHVPPNVLTSETFAAMLKTTGMHGEFNLEYPDFAKVGNIEEIILGEDTIENKKKLYITTIHDHGSDIFAVECKGVSCYKKEYKLQYSLNFDKFKKVHNIPKPLYKQFYNQFYNKPNWEVLTKAGPAIHIMVDPFLEYEFPVTIDSQWKQWLNIENGIWKKIVDTYSSYHLYLVGFTRENITLYVRDGE